MINVLIHPKAEQDIINVYDYYEDVQVGLGDRFYSEFTDIFHLLEIYPEIYSFRQFYKARVGIMRSFPYLIFYTMYKDSVYILGVFSSYQSPKEHSKQLKSRK